MPFSGVVSLEGLLLVPSSTIISLQGLKNCLMYVLRFTLPRNEEHE